MKHAKKITAGKMKNYWKKLTARWQVVLELKNNGWFFLETPKVKE